MRTPAFSVSRTPRRAFVRSVSGWLAAGVVAGLGTGRAQDDANLGGGIVLERTMLPGGGDKFARVDFTIWLPEPGRTVRAVIVHQHGCGNSSATVNPPVARDFHWQALARKHDCALIVPHYTVTGECAEWNDPDSGSERALLAALREFGERSGRAELATAPWVLWGHSGGSSWAVQMILRHPGRVLAASLRGGAHKQFGEPAFRARFAVAARELPLLFVWGREEAVPTSRHFVSWEPMQAMFRDLRASGGQVALAVDPRTEHHCGDSRLLVMPFFATVLAARLAGERLTGAWVNLDSGETTGDSAAVRTDPAYAWLPSEPMARRWREFRSTGRVTRERAPAQRPVLRAAPGADGASVTLRWRVEPELDGGLRTLRLYRDGTPWKEIGGRPDGFLATNRDSPPHGLDAALLRDDTVRPGATHVYMLSFVDAAGTESPRSEPVEVRLPTTP